MNVQQNIITIERISAEQTWPLRMRILRPGQPPENSHYPADQLSTTFHLGVFIDNQIVCNGTFMKDVCPAFPDETSAYRLRGMATDTTHRGLQLGTRLLSQAENQLRQMQCSLLWFNARESAFPFYQKNGYAFFGEMFDIPSIGPHKIMYRKL